jgi:thioredoxin-related protein
MNKIRSITATSILILIGLLVFSLSSQAITNRLLSQKTIEPLDSNTIKWLTIEEAEKLNESEPRLILIDVYTDWCGWCKKMDKATFKNAEVANYVNKYFYAVKFNAEQTDNIIFQKKVYRFNQGSNAHDLAIKFLGGRMGYPTIAYLNKKSSLIAPIQGYFDPKDYKKILQFFKEEHYKKQSLDQYMASN